MNRAEHHAGGAFERMNGVEHSLIGTRLAKKFLIESLLGDGAMGKVYRARHIDLDQTVALKVLRRELASQPSFLARFQREARTTFQIVHSNIVRVLDFGIDPANITYLAMEFVEGSDLSAIITHEAPLATDRIVSLMRQALAGISAAHAVGVVHRDLKPENIMVTRGTDDEGNPAEIAKVCDFGIAKLLAEEGGSGRAFTNPGAVGSKGRRKLTERGLLVGTPEYMAPEYARGEKIDGRADVYAMGVVLFEMLTGRLPFTAISPTAMLLQHVSEPPPLPSSMATVNPKLEQICLKALAKDPNERFQSARAMRSAMAGVVGSRGSLVDGEEAGFRDPPPVETMAPSIGGPDLGRLAVSPGPMSTRKPTPLEQAPVAPSPAPVVAPVAASVRELGATPAMSRSGLLAAFLGLVLTGVGISIILQRTSGASSTATPVVSVQTTSVPTHAAATTANPGANGGVIGAATTMNGVARPASAAPSGQAPRAIGSASGGRPALAGSGVRASLAPSAPPGVAPIDPPQAPTPAAPVVTAAPATPPPVATPAASPPVAPVNPASAAVVVDPTHGRARISGITNLDRVPKRDVQAAMARIVPAMTSCFQAELRASSNAPKSGVGMLHVETDSAGIIVRARASMPFDTAIASCVERAAKGQVVHEVDTGDAEADIEIAFDVAP